MSKSPFTTPRKPRNPAKSRNPFQQSSRKGSPRPSKRNGARPFSLLPIVAAAVIILGGVYWMWNYGDTGQSPLLSWLSGGRVSVYKQANDVTLVEARDKYTQAVEAETAGEHDLASRLFIELEENYPGLRPLISWHLATIHQQQPREDLAQIRLQKLVEEPNLQASFKAKAMYELMRSHIRANQVDLAKEVSNTLKNTYPESDYAKAAMYYEGLMLLKQAEAKVGTATNPMLVSQQLPADVRQLWLEYLKQSPTGTFSIPIIETLEARNYPPNVDQMSYYIKAYTHAKKYMDAIRIANKKAYNINVAGIDVIRSTLAIGDRKQAITYLLYWLPSYSFDETAFREVLNALFPLKEKPTESQLALLKQFYGLAKSPENKQWLLWHLSQVDKPNQANHYRAYMQQYPNTQFAPFVASELIRLDFVNGQNTRVLKAADDYIAKYPASLEAPDVELWKGLASLALHETSKANAIFGSVLEKYPYSYAAFRADHFLNAKQRRQDFQPIWPNESLPLVSNATREPEIWLVDYAEAHEDLPPILVAQLRELANMKAMDDILLLLEMSLDKTSPHYTALMAWAYLLDGQQDTSIRMMRDHYNSLDASWTAESRFKPSPQALRLLYPIHYPAIVQQYAKQADVSPYLTLGLMRQESAFNPNSVSGSNAYGLMQLLVPTAQDMLKAGEAGGITKLTLLQPEANIKYGTRYLSFLNRLLGNDPMLVVASYNAGPGAVGGWANSKASLLQESPDAFVEQIPYDETRHYVHHVFEGMWAYHKLYNVDN
jgi:TolA-binding protein